MSLTQLAKSKRLSFPISLIDREVNLLQRDLRRFYRNYRQGWITAASCSSQGENALINAFLRMKTKVRVFMEKHGLKFDGPEAELNEAYNEALRRWRRVIANISGASKTASHLDGGCRRCNEHRVLIAAAEKKPPSEVPYWLTYVGIIRRIDGLSQDFLFRTVNGAIKMVAVTNGVEWLHWITAEDDRVCDRCNRYGRGGYNGYYRTSWFLPKLPPVHRGCRCIFELILGIAA